MANHTVDGLTKGVKVLQHDWGVSPPKPPPERVAEHNDACTL